MLWVIEHWNIGLPTNAMLSPVCHFMDSNCNGFVSTMVIWAERVKLYTTSDEFQLHFAGQFVVSEHLLFQERADVWYYSCRTCIYTLVMEKNVQNTLFLIRTSPRHYLDSKSSSSIMAKRHLPTKSGVEETINKRFDELIPSLSGWSNE
jgi:hypothetical protein